MFLFFILCFWLSLLWSGLYPVPSFLSLYKRLPFLLLDLGRRNVASFALLWLWGVMGWVFIFTFKKKKKKSVSGVV